MVMEAVASLPDNDEADDPDAGSCKQISLDDLVKPAD
jgi:transposase, IS5 family